jgi:hypothetical protein
MRDLPQFTVGTENIADTFRHFVDAFGASMKQYTADSCRP